MPDSHPLATPRVRAPELPQDGVWLNTDRPWKLAELRDRVVLLDFWTHGCINCQHVLPDLQYLEQKYGDRLVVLGIHSAKFDTEKHLDSVQHAILRHQIAHPVLLDGDRQVWEQYAVRAWPTCVLIDASGYEVGRAIGEGRREDLDASISYLLNAVTPLHSLTTRRQPTPLTTPLAFPGKVLATGDRLFIADSGHHRLLVTTPDGQLLEQIGCGIPGLQDGDFETAQFQNPQGMAFDAEQQVLYVADTDNHALRKIDWRNRSVSTLADDLNSPWDLVLIADILFVAMAGSHQIWAVDLADGALGLYAGSGAEGCYDGDLDESAFAQPSGLATDGEMLYVADSEISSVRSIGLDENPQVDTVCGSGGLFDFGDRDGTGETVRLQHCLGITYGDGVLYLADTYNHKIKRVRLPQGTCETLIDEGLCEPSGVSLAGDRLYIADTNHHAIRYVDLAQGRLLTLEISGLSGNTCSPSELSS